MSKQIIIFVPATILTALFAIISAISTCNIFICIVASIILWVLLVLTFADIYWITTQKQFLNYHKRSVVRNLILITILLMVIFVL